MRSKRGQVSRSPHPLYSGPTPALQCSKYTALLPESASGGAEEAPARQGPPVTGTYSSSSARRPSPASAWDLLGLGAPNSSQHTTQSRAEPKASQPARAAKRERNPGRKGSQRKQRKAHATFQSPPDSLPPPLLRVRLFPPSPPLALRRPPGIALLHCAGGADSSTSPAQRWRRRVERARPVQRRRPT